MNQSKKAQLKAYASLYKEGQKSATKVTARFCAAWLILALRHEGFGKKRIKRVLDCFFSYVKRCTDNEIPIDEVFAHVKSVCGIEFIVGETGDDHYRTDDGEEFEFVDNLEFLDF